MTTLEQIRGDLAMNLQLVAYKNVTVDIPPILAVDEAMKGNHWEPISEASRDGAAYTRYYYGTAQKTYVLASYDGGAGVCSIQAVDESDVLEKLSFPELRALGNMIDKKSVAFIRIYAEKELASAATEEERSALNERNQKMIDEAEVALRKR